MDEPINVVTVFWDGEFRGRDYGLDDVARINSNVAKYTSHELKFWCLTNIKENIDNCESVPLIHGLPGWWSKLEIFRDNLPFSGRSIFFDLDMVICADINQLIELPEELIFAPPKFSSKDSPEVKIGSIKNKRGKKFVWRYSSSVVMWIANKYVVDIDKLISSGLMDIYRGDQDYLGVHFANEGFTFPAEWFEKMRHCYHSGPTNGVKIVSGNPKYMFRKALDKESGPQWVKNALQ